MANTGECTDNPMPVPPGLFLGGPSYMGVKGG